jgi:hypothetical protein
MEFEDNKYIYNLLLPLFTNDLCQANEPLGENDYELDLIQYVYTKTKNYNDDIMIFDGNMYKKTCTNFYTNYLKKKYILMESYHIYKYGFRPCKLVFTGYVFIPKNELYKKAFTGDVKEEFKKCIRKNTILRYRLSGFNFLNCNIDWKVFTTASITLYEYNVNICANKEYNLKSLPNDFSDILNKSKECIWQIELNTSLDVNYSNMKKIFAFAMGLHSRLGEKSYVSLLDDDLLLLISSYIIKKIEN